MWSILTLCAVGAAAAKRPTGPSYTFEASKDGFNAWTTKHGKVYTTQTEHDRRFVLPTTLRLPRLQKVGLSGTG